MAVIPSAISGGGSAGLLGDGSDGSFVLDGSTSFAGTFGTPAGNVYTQARDVYATTLTINAGVTLKPNGYRIFTTGLLLINGNLNIDGNNAAGANGGGQVGGHSLSLGVGGANGGTGAGTGTVPVSHSLATNCGGGNGGSSGGNAGGTGGTGGAASWEYRTTGMALYGELAGTTFLSVGGGIGGGSGGGDGVQNGGGGGGGGGILGLWCSAVTIGAAGNLSAKGGNGAAGVAGNAGGGGGGGGGLILAYTSSAVVNNGTISVVAGALGAGAGTGNPGTAGQAGLYLNVLIK